MTFFDLKYLFPVPQEHMYLIVIENCTHHLTIHKTSILVLTEINTSAIMLLLSRFSPVRLCATP